MSGGFSAGGLVTGIDTNSIVTQLMKLERQPIFRMEDQISRLEAKKSALKELRTELTNFRNKLQDIRIGIDFDKFKSLSSDEVIAGATVSGNNPTTGAFTVDMLQLASATVANSNGRIGASINPAVALDSSGINEEVTSGDFTVNGTTFNFDFSVSSLDDALAAINSSGIGVTASYDSLTDKVTIANTNPSDTSIINFGAEDDTSNFLDLIGVDGAYQYTNGSGSTEVISSVNLGSVGQSVALGTQSYNVGAITGGTFQINGVSITVDPTTDSLDDILGQINSSDAGVRASYDSTTDGIRIVSEYLGSRTVSFTSGASNFLDVMNLSAVTQIAGSDSQFTVDGGPVQTRNSNDVSDVIGGVTINMQSLGTSTITVSQDTDAALNLVKDFIEGFNTSIQKVAESVEDNASLDGDFTIRSISNTLQTMIFGSVSGLPEEFNNVLDIGISTGSTFDSDLLPLNRAI